MNSPPITSLQNSRIKHLVRLRERRHRNTSGTFLIEGFREMSRAVEAGIGGVAVYFCPDLFLGHNEGALLAAWDTAGAELVELGDAAFRKVSYRDRPEGLLAEAVQFETGLERLEPGPDPLFLVVESIEKPGNLGTMLRTADAAGVEAVIVCDQTTDPFNPNVVRASLGTLFTVPLALTASEDAIDWLTRSQVRIVATTPAADGLIWELDLGGAVALVVGSEQYGLTQVWLERAGNLARLPMAGHADSLNAAMAAGISLFEAVRQRCPRPA